MISQTLLENVTIIIYQLNFTSAIKFNLYARRKLKSYALNVIATGENVSPIKLK